MFKPLLIGAARLWAFGLLALPVGSSSAQASTLLVTSPADSGPGSLRAVIVAAQSGDQIVFDQSLSGQTITLTSGPLAITQPRFPIWLWYSYPSDQSSCLDFRGFR
jgi:hypothetical protein